MKKCKELVIYRVSQKKTSQSQISRQGDNIKKNGEGKIYSSWPLGYKSINFETKPQIQWMVPSFIHFKLIANWVLEEKN